LTRDSVHSSPSSSSVPENAHSTPTSPMPCSAQYLSSARLYRRAWSREAVTTIAFALPPTWRATCERKWLTITSARWARLCSCSETNRAIAALARDLSSSGSSVIALSILK
jgi:hypothetical protein